MSKLVLGSSEIIIPSTWNELSTKNLEALATFSMKSLPVQTLKVYMMIHLAELRPGKKLPKGEDGRTDDVYVYYRGRHKYGMTAPQMQRAAHCLSWLFAMDEATNAVHLDCRLVRCPYKHLPGGLRYSPGDGLEAITYEQFVWAQVYEQRLADDPDAVYSLLAALWHSGKTVDADTIAKDAKQLRKLRPAQLTVMYWLWEGSMRFLASKFPRVFGGGGDDGRHYNILEEQQKIIDALADGDVTRKPLVRSSYLYDVLVTMEQTLARQEEELKKMKK